MDDHPAIRDVDQLKRVVEEVRLEMARFSGRLDALESDVHRLRGVPEILSAIKEQLKAIELRMPQTSPAPNPWTITMAIVGWGISFLLLVFGNILK